MIKGEMKTSSTVHMGAEYELSRWFIDAAIDGNTLSGTISRVQQIYAIKFNDPVVTFLGVIEFRWQISATRVR
jgi:hypothetical protein